MMDRSHIVALVNHVNPLDINKMERIMMDRSHMVALVNHVNRLDINKMERIA